jgi:alpha-1,6-mannosyltransferase
MPGAARAWTHPFLGYRPKGIDAMSQHKWVLPVSLGIILILILIPPLLIAPTRTPYYTALSQPITGPQSETGVSQHLTWWNLLLAGLAAGAAVGIGMTVALLRKGTDPGASSRFKLVLILGALSLAIYVFTFLLPYPLLHYYNFKGLSFGVIADRDPAVALSLVAATIALFLLYYIAYRLCRGRNDRRLWMAVVVGAVLLALVTALICLITSLDIYDYIARGRITGVHRDNPYVQTPEQYPGDPFMEYASWKDKTAAYGPVWEVLSGFIGRLAGDQLWPNVVIHKTLALVSYFACTAIIAAILQRVAPKRALTGTLLFAWNPLILLEGVANGHNDLLMMALILGALWAFSKTEDAAGESRSRDRIRRLSYGALGVVLLWLAVLIKFIPILLLPLALLYLLAKESTWRDRIVTGLFLLALIGLITYQYYRVFWQWPEVSYTFTRRGEMFRTSIPSVILIQLKQNMENLTFLHDIARYAASFQAPSAPQPIGPLEVAHAIAGWPFLAAFGIGYLIVLARTAHGLFNPTQRERAIPKSSEETCRAVLGGRERVEKHSWQILADTSLIVFMLYLLLANFWFWPWYLIWPIALLSLSSDKRLLIPLALASCAGELSHVGWNFVWYWWGISWDTLYQLEEIVVACMYAPALLWYTLANYRADLLDSRESQRASDLSETG